MSRIRIHPSKTADTRSCDFATVSKETLLASSRQHIGDVGKGIAFFRAVSADYVVPARALQNDVGELFVLARISEVVDGTEPAIPNLRWLVPMALAENDRHDWPYLVSERGARASS